MSQNGNKEIKISSTKPHLKNRTERNVDPDKPGPDFNSDPNGKKK